MKTPIIQTHDGVAVVCDHLIAGGTKSRYLPLLFEGCAEIVYASSCEGGGQVALATVAKQLGKRCTIFVARRQQTHRRQYEGFSLGAKYVEVAPAYLNVVQARAKQYCKETGAKYAGFGLGQTDDCIEIVADAARSLKLKPSHVWCSAGSGATIRGLVRAWPSAMVHAVQVGHALTPDEVGGAQIHIHPKPYKYAVPQGEAPFRADQHYELKAWQAMKQWPKGKGLTLFWSVMSAPAI